MISIRFSITNLFNKHSKKKKMLSSVRLLSYQDVQSYSKKEKTPEFETNYAHCNINHMNHNFV